MAASTRLTAQQRRTRARIAALTRVTSASYDPRRATHPAREDLLRKYQSIVDPDHKLPEHERTEKAWKAWEITRGKRSIDHHLLWDTHTRRYRKTGIVVEQVRHPAFPAYPLWLWLMVSRPGKGRKPWYLLTNEPALSKEDAWPVVLLFYGAGLGLASAQLTGTVLSGIPREQSGQGSATQSTVRQLGAALGTAIVGAVLAAGLPITSHVRWMLCRVLPLRMFRLPRLLPSSKSSPPLKTRRAAPFRRYASKA